MTCQLSKTQKAILAGVLLGNAIPMAVHAQSIGVMRVNDDVVAKLLSGSQYGLYDVKKDPSHCIGIFDPAAFQQGKDTLIPAGLSNAAELQAISDAAPVYNGKHFIQMTLYKGPAVQLGDCSIAQAPANNTAAAQAPSTPAPGSQAAVDNAMNALSNSVKLQYKIVKADAKEATIQITDSHNVQHMLKITADASGASAFRDSFKQSNRASQDGNFKSWDGHSVRLAIDNGDARWYNPDGTPQVAKEDKFLGQTTSKIMQFWDKSTFAAMADTIKAQLGSDPAYSAVLYAIAGKPAATAPGTNGAK